jgi:hypothetical protein
MMCDRIDADRALDMAQSPSPAAAVTSRDAAKPAPRRFGRVLRGISASLGIVLGLAMLRESWTYPWLAAELRYSTPGGAALTVAKLLAFCALPVVLLLASRPARVWPRLLVAALVSMYGYAVVRPAMFVVFAATDYVAWGQIPDDMPGQASLGMQIMQVHPDPVAAARQALRHGDTRIYFVHGVGVSTPGVNHHPYTEVRLGMREMPGFSDLGEAGAIGAYRHDADCWTARYNRELARHLDGLRPNGSLDAVCGPVKWKR